MVEWKSIGAGHSEQSEQSLPSTEMANNVVGYCCSGNTPFAQDVLCATTVSMSL